MTDFNDLLEEFCNPYFLHFEASKSSHMTSAWRV